MCGHCLNNNFFKISDYLASLRGQFTTFHFATISYHQVLRTFNEDVDLYNNIGCELECRNHKDKYGGSTSRSPSTVAIPMRMEYPNFNNCSIMHQWWDDNLLIPSHPLLLCFNNVTIFVQYNVLVEVCVRVYYLSSSTIFYY